jgi:hypothetical protein
MSTKKTKPVADYHKSAPVVPEGLVCLRDWAKTKGLTEVCCHKWVWAGKLQVYRIPGHGRLSFAKIKDLDAILKPQASLPNIAR